MKYYNEVRIAALLHDIGKFYQKVLNNASQSEDIDGVKVQGSHPVISARFIERYADKFKPYNLDIAAIKEMCQRHHSSGSNPDILISNANKKYINLCELVGRADNISSSERGNEQVKKDRNSYSTPISSIFDSNYKIPIGDFRDTARKATNKPLRNINSIDIKAWILSFANEFKSLDTTVSIDDFISSIDKLLLKYTWCIPSAYHQDIPDISLYDHLKTTSAIAGIMYEELASNSIYAKGMREEDRNLGQEFTVSSVSKDFDPIVIIRVDLRNAIDYIISTDNSINDSLDNQAILQKLYNNAIADILNMSHNDIKLSTVNTIITQGYTTYFLMHKDRLSKLQEIIDTHNKKIINATAFKTYIVYSFSEFSIKKGADSAYKALKLVNSYIDSQSKNFYGVHNIVVKDNKWENSYTLYHDEDLSSLASKNSQLTFNNGTLMLLRFTIYEFDTSINRIFKNKNDSISRVSTISRSIKQLFDIIAEKDKTILYESNTVILVLPFKAALSHADKIKALFDDITSETFEIHCSITTFNKNRSLVEVYKNNLKQLEELQYDEDGYTLSYNGIPIGWKSLDGDSSGDIDTTYVIDKLDMIEKSIKLNKSIIYRISGYCSDAISLSKAKMKHLDCTPYSMFAARFEHDKLRNFNDRTIDGGLKRYIENQLNLVASGKTATKSLEVTTQVIKDALSISTRG